LRHAASEQLDVAIGHQPGHLLELVRGSQPSFSRAFEESPTRCSTSAGRREARIEAHVLLRTETHVLERHVHQRALIEQVAGVQA